MDGTHYNSSNRNRRENELIQKRDVEIFHSIRAKKSDELLKEAKFP